MKRFLRVGKNGSCGNGKIEFDIVLMEPSLNDNKSDLERLLTKIHTEHDIEISSVSPYVLRDMPFVLRESGWCVICSVQSDGNGNKFLVSIKSSKN